MVRELYGSKEASHFGAAVTTGTVRLDSGEDRAVLAVGAPSQGKVLARLAGAVLVYDLEDVLNGEEEVEPIAVLEGHSENSRYLPIRPNFKPQF